MNQENLRDIQLRHREKYEARRKEEENERIEAEEAKSAALEETRRKEELDRQMTADEEYCRQLQAEMSAEDELLAAQLADAAPETADGIRAPMRTGYVDRLVDDDPWYSPPVMHHQRIHRANQLDTRRHLGQDGDDSSYAQRFLFLFIIGLFWSCVTWYKPDAMVPVFSLCSVLTLLIMCF